MFGNAVYHENIQTYDLGSKPQITQSTDSKTYLLDLHSRATNHAIHGHQNKHKNLRNPSSQCSEEGEQNE